jgi:hypothetical protein
MRRHRKWLVLGGCVAVASMVAFVPRTHASMTFDNQRGDIAARVATQNTFQHNGPQDINWVQWRNEVRFDLRYDLLGRGNSIGPINYLRGNLLWRGRYDAAYELRDSYRARDYNRGDFEFPEGKEPRELFFDIGFSGALKNLSMRIGKQQVVWGEADLFRSLDIVNPLDIRQNGFVGEDFSDIRQPLYIAKFLYNLGDVAKFWNEAGIEAFFSPNGRPQGHQTNALVGETWKISTNQSVVNVPGGGNFNFNRNMSLPFSQVRAPWELLRVGARNGDSPAVVQNSDGTLSDFMYRIKDDVPSSFFSTAAMMGGVRLLGTTYGNAYFTLNYLFKKSDTTSANAIFSQIFDPLHPGTGEVQPDVLARAVNATLTPDLNGNGIPDGQDQQILNCLQSKSPTSTGFAGSSNPLGVGPMKTPGAGELILPGGSFDGSVYSDPAHPELHTGVKRPGNALATDHVPYSPVFPVPGDGLVHNSACLDVPVFHAWTHVIGMSATYNDYDYTGLVFRMEQSFSTKEPGQFTPNTPERLLMQQKNCPFDPALGINHCTGPVSEGGNGGDPIYNAVVQEKDFATRGKRYFQVWRSMIGFDYLKAIAPQFGKNCKPELLRSLLSDQWFFTFQFLDTYRSKFNQLDHSGSFTDRYQQWNPFFTLSGTGFFMHQTFRPTWAVFADAAKGLQPGAFLQIAYFLTPKLELRLGEVLYMGSAGMQDDGGLSLYADRDTFYARLTYFLA